MPRNDVDVDLRPVVGDVIGERVVIAVLSPSRVRMRCRCGKESRVDVPRLAAGRSRLCNSCSNTEKKTTHGATTKAAGRVTPEYKAWRGMRARCTNPAHADWHNYGGRGVTVCAEWDGHGGFAAFLAHIGRRPSSKHSIDRIDNNRGYAPGNVRWATVATQANNRRKTRTLTVRGVTRPFMEWVRESGLGKSTIAGRLEAGLSHDRAVLEPPIPHVKRRAGWKT